MNEIWKELPNLYTRKYEVSNMGRIRSMDSQVSNPIGGQGRKGKILKPLAQKSGLPYLKVVLHSVDGKKPNILIHHAVALVFIGERPAGHLVLHKDGDCQNNKSDNLYYGTRNQNYGDSRSHGTSQEGQRHYLSNLSESDAIFIFKSKLPGVTLSEMFKINTNTISRIRLGKSYKNITSQIVCSVQD